MFLGYEAEHSAGHVRAVIGEWRSDGVLVVSLLGR
jgi:hypothetical protein